MMITFATEELEKLCNDGRYAVRRLGAMSAKQLRRRLDDLHAAPDLLEMRGAPGRCHELKGDLAGCLAMDLHGGWRLIFKPDHEPILTKPDGGLDWGAVTAIQVQSIEDYHD